MVREFHPAGPVTGSIAVPGSKSITNRALVCAALAAGESTLRHASDSDDTAMMINGLNQMGVLVLRREDTLVVRGRGGALDSPKFPIPVGNAGTTLRFLLGLSALARGRVVLEGSGRMAERPNDDLVQALRALGVTVRTTAGTARFEVEGGSLRGGAVTLRADRSSQFLSALLLVSPYAESGVTVTLAGSLASASYVDLTQEVMRAFGVSVVREGASGYHVAARQSYACTEYAVEADASGASYAFAAAAIAGGEVFVPGISRRSLQGDTGFLDVLERMGCSVREHRGGVSVERRGSLHGVDVSMNSMPDVVPTLAAVALFAEEATRIRDVAHLRHKESNRIETLAGELRRAGAAVRPEDDGLTIMPGELHAASIDPHDDHRIAMSCSLIGLRVAGIRIGNPLCVRKSFPSFWEEFSKIAAVS